MVNKTSVGETLKAIREQRGLTQRQLAKLTDLSSSYIVLLEKGLRKGVSLRVARKFGEVLGVQANVFLPGYNDPLVIPGPRPLEAILREAQQSYELLDSVEVPIYGVVPAGYPFPEEENIEGHIAILKAELGRPAKGLYALRVSGECLLGDGITDGDLLVVDRDDAGIEDGRIYIARVEDEVVARHVYRQLDKVRLTTTNQNYEVILPRNSVEILGRVILSGRWRKH